MPSAASAFFSRKPSRTRDGETVIARKTCKKEADPLVFSTIIFLFRFLPITLALYYLAPAKLKNTVLFLCSLVFYCWG